MNIDLVDYVQVAGIAGSLVFAYLAFKKSSKANEISSEANSYAKMAAETADMAFKYSTGMVWQLVGYEQKKYTEPHKLPLPLAGDIYLALSALGTDAVKDVSIEFSYDPYGVLVKNRNWLHYDPKTDQNLVVYSGLKAARFMEVQQKEESKAIIRWTDVANNRREFHVELKTVQFPKIDLEIPDDFPED